MDSESSSTATGTGACCSKAPNPTLYCIGLFWVGLLALGPQSCHEPGSSGPVDTTPTGAANEMAIHYKFVEYSTGGGNGDFWDDDRDLSGSMEYAFKAADIDLAFKFDAIPIFLLDLISSDNPAILEAFFDEYPPDSEYPYLLVGIPYFVDSYGQPDPTALGRSSALLLPGYTPNQKMSFIARQSIKEDMIEETVSGSTNLWPELFAATVIHELGHVRASLRHPHQFPDDHTPTSQSEFAHCVMHSLEELPWSNTPPNVPNRRKVLQKLSFCGVANTADMTSCVVFLKRTSSQPGPYAAH